MPTLHNLKRWLRHAGLVWLCALGAPAVASEPVQVGLFEMPPYYSQGPSGQPEGYLVDILDRVMGQLGYTWQPQFQPVPQLLKGVAEGELDLLMLIRHPMLEHQAVYSRQPVSHMRLRVYHHDPSIPIAGLASLRGQRVAILKGYGYGGLLHQLTDPTNGLKIRVADDHQHAFRLLDQNRVNYVLDYEKPAQSTIDALALEGIDSQLLHEQPIYFVVSKNADQKRQLTQRLERAATTLGLQ